MGRAAGPYFNMPSASGTAPVLLYLRTLCDPSVAKVAVRVALIIGTVLLAINHGPALLAGSMTPERWISACLTYAVPFLVNVHGQFIGRLTPDKSAT